MHIDELITSLFDAKPNPLAEPVAGWLASSRRFTAFVTANHTKVRKKIRTVQDPESLRDLQLELETAYLLLGERALSLEYEPERTEPGRRPDFAVSFTTSFLFMLEVTRLRAARSPGTPAPVLDQGVVETPGAVRPLADRFTDMLCDKLHQLVSQRSNVLLVGVDDLLMTYVDLRLTMLRLQQRAEKNDPYIVEAHGFHDRPDFFQHYQRLSALLVRAMPSAAAQPVLLWANPQAKYPLPARVQTALSRSHSPQPNSRLAK